MFGFFAGRKADVVGRAVKRASHEVNEDLAVARFVKMVSADEVTVSELRETYGTTIDELYDQSGIADAERRRAIRERLFESFDSNLSATAREYLRDQSAGVSTARMVVIEFSSFAS